MPQKGPKSNSTLLSQQPLGGLGNDKLESPPKSCTDLGIQQQEQWVVRCGMSSPLQHIRQE